MSTLTQFTTMEDAYYYFFQAKGSTDTSQGTVLQQRHLRTAVILGWAAVDDAVTAFAVARNLKWSKDRRGLFPRLQLVWSELGKPAPDEAEVKRYRDARNRIAHPDGIIDVQLTVQQVDEVLSYCKATIRVMYPHMVSGEEARGRLAGF